MYFVAVQGTHTGICSLSEGWNFCEALLLLIGCVFDLRF